MGRLTLVVKSEGLAALLLLEGGNEGRKQASLGLVRAESGHLLAVGGITSLAGGAVALVGGHG